MPNNIFQTKKWPEHGGLHSKIHHPSINYLSTHAVITPEAWLNYGAAFSVEIAKGLMEPKCILETDVPWDNEKNAQPDCMSVDFAIVQNTDGDLDFKLIEAQAYASIYHTLLEMERTIHIPSLFSDKDWLQRKAIVKKHITHGLPKEQVVMLAQTIVGLPTFHDFLCAMDDVTPVCLSEIYQHNNQWWYLSSSGPTIIHRIYNRVIYSKLQGDEKERMDLLLSDTTLSWYNHPAWFDKINKKSLLSLQHPTNPKTAPASKPWPDDLSKWVLKTPDGHSGKGVFISPSQKTMECSNPAVDFLQEKVSYVPCVSIRDMQNPLCMEIRFLLSYDHSTKEWIPITNLARLSYHGMISESMARCWPGEGATICIGIPLGYNAI